jgi:hypothetical protein
MKIPVLRGVMFDAPEGSDFFNNMVGHHEFIDDLYAPNGGPATQPRALVTRRLRGLRVGGGEEHPYIRENWGRWGENRRLTQRSQGWHQRRTGFSGVEVRSAPIGVPEEFIGAPYSSLLRSHP